MTAETADKKTVALTFDDGPNPGITDEIIDILEENGIVASFFVVGQNINEENAKRIRRAYSLGCEINNHSFTHSYMDKLTEDVIGDEIKRTTQLIYETVGEYPRFFRPPYIAVNQTMFDCIELPFICGIHCSDWENRVSAEERTVFLENKCPDGAIILLHDFPGNQKTADAVRAAVPVMLGKGYEFVTVTELFRRKGVTPGYGNGIIYSFASETGDMIKA